MPEVEKRTIPIEEAYEVTKDELDALRSIGAIGAKNASSALSKLIDSEVAVMSVGAKVLPIEKLGETIGTAEDVVTTIVLAIYGDVYGNLALVFPKGSALRLADLLAKRPVGTAASLNTFDESALKETSNIVSGSFLAALSNYVGLNMIESIPDLMTDMVKATVDHILTRFAKKAESAMAFQIDFEFGSPEVRGYCFVLLEPISAKKVVAGLKERLGKEKVLPRLEMR